MGSLQAQEMAEHAPLATALHWHLTGNHYPPVPLEWIPLCEEIVLALRDAFEQCACEEDIDSYLSEEVDNPVREGETITRGKIVEGLHLYDLC